MVNRLPNLTLFLGPSSPKSANGACSHIRAPIQSPQARAIHPPGTLRIPAGTHGYWGNGREAIKSKLKGHLLGCNSDIWWVVHYSMVGDYFVWGA